MIAALAATLTMTVCATPAASADPGATTGDFCAIDVRQGQLVCSDTVDGLDVAWRQANQTRSTQYLVATLYDNVGFNTAAGYLDIYGAGNCTTTTSDVDGFLSNLGTWSSRVSSFEGYGSCALRLWTGTSFTGTAYPGAGSYLAASTNVGTAMNDKAKSVQFS